MTMNKRQAKIRALRDAAAILRETPAGGWPEDVEDDEDAQRCQEAMESLADELGARAERLTAHSKHPEPSQDVTLTHWGAV